MKVSTGVLHASLAFLAALACATSGRAEVLITEIHYNPPEGSDAQFVEIHNSGPAEVDLAGWQFTRGIGFEFLQGARIAAGDYLVLGKSPDTLHAVYPGLPESAVAGTFGGSLANEGERITLVDVGGAVRQDVTYGDDSPWDFLADGFGASLERSCLTAPEDLPENWRASPVPAEEGKSGGSPGAASALEQCPPSEAVRPRVFISEIMYHPVLEEALEDFHEFIEIHNAESTAVPLAGWRLAGGAQFTFPAGASIEPGKDLVIAKNKTRLAAVPGYALEEASIFGDYEGELDNGGDKVALIGADGQGVDSVSYDDDSPWPAGADALGASEEWLAPELLPLETHRYRGISLERVSFDVPAGELYNWAPSPLDGATPGRPNASARTTPLPVVAEVLARASVGSDPLIREGEEVRVQVLFSPRSPQGAVELDYFIDLVMTTGEEPITTLTMYDDGATGGDLVAGDHVFTALLPVQEENTIVRFRIRADRGSGSEQVAPRPSDPNPWSAYFVSPRIETTTRLYQFFIGLADWGKMWTGIQGGRVSGCKESATWDKDYPAVLIYNGKVIDALVRYQGSRYNRTNGPNIAAWPYPKPIGGPNPLRALSLRVSLPRYSQIDGVGELVLNKNTQGCPGYNAGVGYRLFEAADVPGSHVRFARVHLNGGYYHYMVEYERPGEEMLRRYEKEQSKKYPDRQQEKIIGHLFKAQGCNCDEGPFGWGDERVLAATCGYTAEQRYAATYNRKTHGWDNSVEFGRMIDDLAKARRAGVDAIREFFFDRFDFDVYMNYVVVMNWSVPFDDMFQNHYLYQRISDGKWIVFPWDIDQNFGEWKGATASIYMGEQNDPDNRSAWWNYLKDAFLKGFREEYNDRLLLLNNTILHPDNVSRLVDEFTAITNPAEAQKSPAGVACSFPARIGTFKAFAVQRLAIVNSKVAGVNIDAGSAQTVYAGATVQFDARATLPDPSAETPYTWDNGMTGDFPTFVFDKAGVFTVRLTVKVRDIPFVDSVTITVLDSPAKAFQERGGQVVMEAESFHGNERHGAVKSWWDADSTIPGFSGASYMKALEKLRQTFLQKYAETAPELRFAVRFENPGTYRVWLRAQSSDAQADSVYVGLDGAERNPKFATLFQLDPAAFLWSGDTRADGAQQIVVTQPGLHLFSIWIRESGQTIDKVILTTDLQLVPEGNGPAESGQVPLGGGGTFVRGDADGDRKINVSDAIVLLLHLFAGGPLACGDRADVDDSGNLDLTDAVYLLDYLFKKGIAPVAPFPSPGEDPTPDALECGA